MKPSRYVCGIVTCGNEVVLIRKNRPEWQAGLLNGVGGRVEEKETLMWAMRREFTEEAGLCISVRRWDKFLTLKSNDAEVSFFHAEINRAELDSISAQTDEPILKMSIGDVTGTGYATDQIIPNLSWIIPMAMDHLIRQAVVTDQTRSNAFIVAMGDGE